MMRTLKASAKVARTVVKMASGMSKSEKVITSGAKASRRSVDRTDIVAAKPAKVGAHGRAQSTINEDISLSLMRDTLESDTQHVRRNEARPGWCAKVQR